jgi:FkbM family methyltransferase
MIEMQSKLVSFHVGSRNVGIGFPILPAFSQDIINVLFDADVDSVAQTSQAWRRMSKCETRVFPYCISEGEGTETLYVNFDAYTSSLLPFNPEYKECYTYFSPGRHDYVLGEAMRTMEARPVTTQAIDTLLQQPAFRETAPNFLSLDTQGSEYRILLGARRALHRHILGLLVEVEFAPIYKDQPLFGDIQKLIENSGFRLAGITLHGHGQYSPYRGPIPARGRGFVLSGEALALRRVETLVELITDVDQLYLMLQKLAFISVMFERLEYALQVLELAKRLSPSTDLLTRLDERAYCVFLRQMLETVASLPQTRPPTMGEVMTFDEAQARFKD